MYRKVRGYEGRYLISDQGRLVSLWGRKCKFLTPSINKAGYIETCLAARNGKRKNEKWHRLVAVAFLPNLKNKKQVNHKNGIKTDNRVENLEWVTQSENIQHAIIVLGKKFGLSQGIRPKWLTYKLNEKQVENIKIRLKNGEKGKHIAIEYQVSDQTIYDIKNGRCWK